MQYLPCQLFSEPDMLRSGNIAHPLIWGHETLIVRALFCVSGFGTHSGIVPGHMRVLRFIYCERGVQFVLGPARPVVGILTTL